MSDNEIRRAQDDVEQSTRRLEHSLDRLKDQLGHRAERVAGVLDVARHPGDKVREVVGGFVGTKRDAAGNALGHSMDLMRAQVTVVRDRASHGLKQAGERPLLSGAIVFAGFALVGALVGGRLRPRRLSMMQVSEFIDKCTARWYFERTSVQLYEEAIVKCPAELRRRLIEIRNEEKAHEEMLEDVIRKYGFDPHTMTESARNTMIQSQGVVTAVMDEDFEGVLQALLTAELVDVANWDLLKKLARSLGDDEAYDCFDDALATEEKHLLFIRELVVGNTMRRVKGAA